MRHGTKGMRLGTYLLLLLGLLAGVGGYRLGFDQGHAQAEAEVVPPPIDRVVVCDSVEPEPVKDPRDPYLRKVVVGCTLGDANGHVVEVRFID